MVNNIELGSTTAELNEKVRRENGLLGTLKKVLAMFLEKSTSYDEVNNSNLRHISSVVKQDCKGAHIHKKYWVMRIKTPRK